MSFQGGRGQSASDPRRPVDAAQTRTPSLLGPASSLWRTLPGRIVLISGSLLVVLLAAGQLVTLPLVFDIVRRVAWISWLVSSAWLVGRAIGRYRRSFLWRVRRKLLLSYVFLGAVPVVLIGAFVLAASVLLYATVAAYVFRDSYSDAMRTVRDIAESSAIEVARAPALASAGLERRYDNLRTRYPGLSLALVPLGAAAGGSAQQGLTAGAWAHVPAPTAAPAWLPRDDGHVGTLVVPDGDGAGLLLIVRAAVPTPDGTRLAIADLPVDRTFIEAQRDRTGVTMTPIAVTGCGVDVAAPADATGGESTMFRQTVAFLDCTDWVDGRVGSVSVRLDAPVADVYARLAAFGTSPSNTPLTDWASVLLQLLWMLGVLFFIIQASAVVMGVLLARSITSAVHELFEGTERVRQGDFTHRIRIESRDQLGDLADSFNRMSASIEHLLHVQREKQRLDDELRIAREIQKSLLPEQPPRMHGLDVADLCEPAREVGGDYYDFFTLGPRRLGMLVADVAGKGTSAALYMAELKGVMLALSRTERSPRAVLTHVNRLLADHLDHRSFITMTYAVVDLEARTLTLARAGHTPMMRVSKGTCESVTPDGMVLGLSLPGAIELFDRHLEEYVVPIAPGDLFVLYTDGVTEAMDAGGELFGESNLARVLTSQHELGAAGIRERVLREVRAFVGDADAHDDMTMIVLKVTTELAEGG